MDTKQVIVIRRDLKMRRGKEIAQGSHASMMFLLERVTNNIPLSFVEKEWVNGIWTKVCLQVDSEQELLAIYKKAKDAHLEAHLVTDLGKTEFHGVNTYTALAIGPDISEKIDAVTGGLKLY